MPSWKKVIVSGSVAALNSLTVTNGVTGSLLGTASYSSNSDQLDGLHATSFVLNSQTSSMSVSTATTATNVTATANNSTNETTYITFVDGATGAQGIETDTALTYNPSTNILTAGTFAGALTGNASSANEADKIYQNDTGGSGEFLIPMADQNVENYARLYNTSNQSDVLRYNVGTSTLISKFFSGDLDGNAVTATAAISATNIGVTDAGADTTTWVLLAGSQTGTQGARSDAGLTYNASTNALTATTFIGALSGNASTATTAVSVITTPNNSTNETTYITFVDGTTGAQEIETDISLTYNPSTNILTAGTFAGALSGNATTATSATSATNATNATNLNVLNSTTNASYPFVFSTTTTAGNKPLYTDTATTCYINPSTNVIGATTFIGALSGNATTATSATSATNATNATNVAITTQDVTPVTFYLTFTSATTGNGSLNVDATTLTYAPNTGIFSTPIVNSTTGVRGGDGSASTPAFSFSGDTNNGMYRITTDTLGFSTAGGERLRITAGGAMGLGVNPTNTSGRFEASNDIVAYSSSDKNWKKNIININSPLEKISQINGVEFDWIEDEPIHGNKGHDVGVIAQEIELVIPEAVQTRESGMKAVQYDKIIPLLIESIKEQQKQIDELKELVNKLTK